MCGVPGDASGRCVMVTPEASCIEFNRLFAMAHTLTSTPHMTHPVWNRKAWMRGVSVCNGRLLSCSPHSHTRRTHCGSCWLGCVTHGVPVCVVHDVPVPGHGRCVVAWQQLRRLRPLRRSCANGAASSGQ